LNNSLSRKLDKKSFSEKELTFDAATELEVVVDIYSSNYFQMYQGVCIH
jgi:hypothetical protein